MYLAVTHLEGLGRVEDMLQALGRSMPDVLALHTMTVVEEDCAKYPGQVCAAMSAATPLAGPQLQISQRPTCLQMYKVFDFLPEKPTSPETALRLLAGGRVKGLTRERHLRGLPRKNCFLVAQSLSPEVNMHLIRQTADGSVLLRGMIAAASTAKDRAAHMQACEAARDFNRDWPLDLQLLTHHCHHHTHALIQHLTGKAVDVNASMWWKAQMKV